MKLFISYPWTLRSQADEIDEVLSHFEVIVVRDIRDLKQLENIKSFMEQIKEADFAILLISDAYLKSKNCLYEAIKLLENKDFKKKAVPFLISDIKISSPQIRLAYLQYWETQTVELEEAIRNGLNSIANSSNLIKELEQFQLIRVRLDEFFNFLTEHLCFSFEEQQAKKFSSLISYLSIRPTSNSSTLSFKASETIPRINFLNGNGSNQVVDIYRLLLNISNNKKLEIGNLLGHIQEIANNLSDYFKIKTNSDCAVSIKLLQNDSDNEEPAVFTLIRDLNSSAKYNDLDNIKSKIFDNTSYKVIINSITTENPVFISNNLTKEVEHSNSFFFFYRNMGKKFNNKGSWLLPYKSVMVAPIFNKGIDKKIALIGFLNIDSLKANVFDSDSDLKLISDIGEQLFFSLQQLIEHRVDV